MDRFVTRLGQADAELSKRLNDELDAFNASATPDAASADELTVRVLEDGELVAGASGWTWA